jgi:hypothetical protein
MLRRPEQDRMIPFCIDQQLAIDADHRRSLANRVDLSSKLRNIGAIPSHIFPSHICDSSPLFAKISGTHPDPLYLHSGRTHRANERISPRQSEAFIFLSSIFLSAFDHLARVQTGKWRTGSSMLSYSMAACAEVRLSSELRDNPEIVAARFPGLANLSVDLIMMAALDVLSLEPVVPFTDQSSNEVKPYESVRRPVSEVQ